MRRYLSADGDVMVDDGDVTVDDGDVTVDDDNVTVDEGNVTVDDDDATVDVGVVRIDTIRLPSAKPIVRGPGYHAHMRPRVRREDPED